MIEVREAVNTIIVKKLERSTYKIYEPHCYRILWLEQGVEYICIDMQSYKALPYTIVFMLPERRLRLKFHSGDDPRGWIIQFPRSFFIEKSLQKMNIHQAELFRVKDYIPQIALSPKIGNRINSLAEMISELMQSQIPNKELAVSSLLRTLLVYCDSKCNIPISQGSNLHYLDIVSRFKHLVADNLTRYHQVSEYASILCITPRYLNQVVKMVMGVTAKYVIQEQLMIQACRDLKFSNQSIKEISIKLGFSEPEHFSNFFKKSTGCSPQVYRYR